MKWAGPLRQGLRRLLRPVRLGVFRRARPLSDFWGFDRGTPVDRYYIESFLAAHREDVKGRVLEVQDSRYTDRFGTGVEHRDVLDIDASNPRATIVADLTAANGVPENAFDCFILTQTLHLIYDFRAALRHAHRALKPGGVLLATLPSVSRVSRGAAETDCWRVTPVAASIFFGQVFGPERVTVHAYGNVLTAIAFLSGMAHEELSRRDLEARDDAFPVIVAVRAVKA